MKKQSIPKSNKAKELHKLISRISETLVYLNSKDEVSEQAWNEIAWDISKAVNQLRGRAELPDYDYKVLRSPEA